MRRRRRRRINNQSEMVVVGRSASPVYNARFGSEAFLWLSTFSSKRCLATTNHARPAPIGTKLLRVLECQLITDDLACLPAAASPSDLRQWPSPSVFHQELISQRYVFCDKEASRNICICIWAYKPKPFIRRKCLAFDAQQCHKFWWESVGLCNQKSAFSNVTHCTAASWQPC